MISDEQQQLLRLVVEHAARLETSVYLVGGFVRDFLLGSPLHDLDIDLIVEGDLQVLAQQVQDRTGGELKFYPKFLTAKIVDPEKFSSFNEIDFAHARTEKYKQPGSLPDVYPATIKEDLFRRDFTVNAIAITLEGLLDFTESDFSLQSAQGVFFDPFSGVSDLEARTIRVMHDQSFIDDPTRIFRAVRYLTRIQGVFDPHTEELFEASITQHGFQTISSYRIFTECKKILAEKEWQKMLLVLQQYGGLAAALSLQTSQAQDLVEALSQRHIPEDLNPGYGRFELFLLEYSRYLSEEEEQQLIQNIGLGKTQWAKLKTLQGHGK